MKKVLLAVAYATLFFTGVFAVVEGYFRLPGVVPEHERIIRTRLWALWGSGFKSDPFIPPFRMFADVDIENEERLREVYEASVLKPGNYISYDFLRGDRPLEELRYSVNVNSLGFRGEERPAKKPGNVFRILALGTYSTFGHAVADEETWTHQLELMLNREKPDPQFKYEVWNGGRHAATAIYGLARLKFDSPKLRPDVILWDFGWTDHKLLGDNLFVHHFHLPERHIYDIVRVPMHLFSKVFGECISCIEFAHRIRSGYEKKNLNGWIDTLHELDRFVKRSEIPALLLKSTRSFVPEGTFFDISAGNPLVGYVNVQDALNRFPPSAAQKENFWKNPKWVDEFDPKEIQERSPRIYKTFDPFEYYQDYYQLNPAGHKALARFIYGALKSQGLLKKRYKSRE